MTGLPHVLRRVCRRISQDATRGLVAMVLVALALVSSVPVRAQSGAVASTAEAIPAAAISDLLRQLDECFGRADVAAYLARWQPDHPGAHAQMGRQLTTAFAAGIPLQRTTTLVGEPRRLGERTVVRVHHELRAADGSAETVFVQDAMLALLARPDGIVVPTFAIEIPTAAKSSKDDLFRCPVCNYQIGGVAGWLCVPQRSDRAMALEAATFFLVGTDVSCDISVQIDDDAAAPIGGGGDPAAEPGSHKKLRATTVVAEQFAATLCQMVPGARQGLATAWLPEAHGGPGATATAQLSGARVVADLPADRTNPDGSRAVFYVVALGALQHVLLVRGSPVSLQTHAEPVRALLASYRMLDPDCDRALAAARPLQHHSGGSLRNGLYSNPKWDLALAGPPGWTAEQRSGGCLFRVVWTSATGSRLWLLGYDVPAGMQRWCPETAELWLAELCAERGLSIVDNRVDPAPGTAQPGWDPQSWEPAEACSAQSRLVRCTWQPSGSPLGPQTRLLRVFVRDDVMIVLDATGSNEADWVLLRQALDGLRKP